MSTYKVSISTKESDALNPPMYEATSTTESDPSEIIASVQTLFPTWSQVQIDRVDD